MRLKILAGILGLVSGFALNNVLHPNQLPYTEPHHEFMDKRDRDCVAWDFATVGAHVIICEGQPPVLVTKKQKTGLMA